MYVTYIKHSLKGKAMSKKFIIIVLSILFLISPISEYTLATIPGEINEGEISLNYRSATVYAPAVAQTTDGYVGVISTITVTVQDNGSGRVFVDTLPLTQIDMQGSARLAVKVASALVENDVNSNIDPSTCDYFFVVRTSAPIIGGPSAGGVMTVAAIALLENWGINQYTVMTGMINPDGSIGPIGGIVQKIDAAASVGATSFLIPKGQGVYFETVTTTQIINEIPRLITTQETRYVADYAMDHYGINVFEVEDVNEALGYFTGNNFTMTGQDNNITTEGYIDSMKPLAFKLLEESTALYDNASAFFENSTIPNYYPDYQRTTLNNALSDASELIEKSNYWYGERLYYSSISWSFQSLIYSRFVYYGCSYFNSENGDRYIQSLLEDVASFYITQSELAKNAEIKGMISLQCVGIAQSRAGEANSYISEALASFNNYDRLNALYRTAFAMERSKSVGWWLNISSNFIDTGNINVTSLEKLATEYRDDAQQAIIYSSVILQEIGSSSTYLSSAEDLLDIASSSVDNDFPAAALFESLNALVKANLAIETIEIEPEDKIERAREQASNSIGNSRSLGFEPVLAVSYYEYAESLNNESSFSNALFYYKYSNIIAGALGLLTNFTGGRFSSRYVGIPETGTNVWSYLISTYLEYFMIFALLMGLIGFAFGLIVATAIISLKKDEKPAIKDESQKIDDYYKRQSRYFSGDDIPRSIKDYYKKNK